MIGIMLTSQIGEDHEAFKSYYDRFGYCKKRIPIRGIDSSRKNHSGSQLKAAGISIAIRANAENQSSDGGECDGPSLGPGVAASGA